jgi:SAM-dependent methyltransferase
MEENCQEWYSEWFNSPFYHILYKHRDLQEAENFISRLQNYLHFQKGQTALDAGCGRGRHSLFLNSKGLQVDGIDLSTQNIEYAKQFEKEGLKFWVHDMRYLFQKNQYNYVFNLFTSFGYFENDNDNFETIQAFADGLKETGVLVIDFLNPTEIIKGLIPEEEKEVEGIKFKISRKLKNGFIVKDIGFDFNQKNYCYSEKVQALTKEHFMNYFSKAELQVDEIFGSYQLEHFEEESSDRMIFIVRKK